MAEDATSKYEGAGTTFWTNELGQRVEINRVFAEEQHDYLLAKGWKPGYERPSVITIDELDTPENEALQAFHGQLFNKTRQCAEGLIMKEPALLTDGQRSIVGDQTTEYRCELEADHQDWHEDGEHRWKTY